MTTQSRAVLPERAAAKAAVPDAGVVRAVTIDRLAVPLRRPMLWAGGRDDHAVALLVRIETDTGLTGVGECPAALGADVVDAAARSVAASVVGRPVAELLARPASSYRPGRWQYFPRLANYAICGLEAALWDIAGKAAGAPVHALLGEAVRGRIGHFCWLHRGEGVDDLVAQAAQGLAAGHDVFYVKVGIDESAVDVVRLVETVRAALGPAPRLRVDANQAWTLDEALRVLDEVGACDLDWIEEPVAGASIADLRAVRSLGVRVAVDQGAWLPDDILELASNEAVDVVCTDASRLGGLRELLRVAAALDDLGVQLCRHCGNEFGVFLAAALHACAVVPNLTTGNQYCDQLGWDVVEEELVDPTGEFPVPTRPGLGVTLDEGAVAAAKDCYERAFAA